MSNPEDQETIYVNHHVVMGEALERLTKNADFQTVIVEGYLDQCVKASVSLLAVPDIKSRGERPAVFEDLISASNLQYYFQQVASFHEAAIQDESGELNEDFDEDEDSTLVDLH